MSNRFAARSNERVGGSTDARLRWLVAIVIAFTVAAIASELAAGMFRPWNDARLAPSAGWLRGHALYAAPGEPGVVWSWLYGPIAPLVYLPAAAAGTPARAVALALLLSAVLFAASLRGLLRSTAVSRGPTLELAFAALLLLSLVDPALRGAGYWVHVDAPALALASLATLSLVQPGARPAALARGAVFAALAVATKQVLLPLPVVLAGWLWWRDGRPPALRFAAVALATGLAIALAATAVFGAGALWFNLVTVPGAHPWQWGGGAPALARAAGEWAIRGVPLLAVAIGPGAPDGRTWREAPRATLIVVGVAMALVGIATRVKVGAAENAHAYGLLFLSVAAAGALADQVTAGVRAARAGLAVVLVVGIAATASAVAGLPRLLRALPDNPETTGLALARSAPGTTYFPFHPLITLYAEDRTTHVSYGLFDRHLAGFPLSDQALRAHTAPRLEQVALWATRDDYVLGRLPELDRVVPYGPQPGWQLFQRSPSASSGKGATPASP